MLSALNSRTFLLLGTGVKPLTNAKEFVVSVDGVGKGEQGRGAPKEFTKFEEWLRESSRVRGSQWRVFIVWRAIARPAVDKR
jgi:hypothetical protein